MEEFKVKIVNVVKNPHHPANWKCVVCADTGLILLPPNEVKFGGPQAERCPKCGKDERK